jgi:hypothetical protein
VFSRFPSGRFKQFSSIFLGSTNEACEHNWSGWFWGITILIGFRFWVLTFWRFDVLTFWRFDVLTFWLMVVVLCSLTQSLTHHSLTHFLHTQYLHILVQLVGKDVVACRSEVCTQRGEAGRG